VHRIHTHFFFENNLPTQGGGLLYACTRAKKASGRDFAKKRPACFVAQNGKFSLKNAENLGIMKTNGQVNSDHQMNIKSI